MADEEADPVAWLRAQVEADRATAIAASGDGDPPATWTMEGHGGSSALIRDEHGGVVVYDEGSPVDEEAAHMVLHDPRNVVADCEAKLAILDACIPGENAEAALEAGDISAEEYVTGEAVGAGVVRLLLAAYKHRSGYDEKWGVPA